MFKNIIKAMIALPLMSGLIKILLVLLKVSGKLLQGLLTILGIAFLVKLISDRFAHRDTAH